MPTTFDRTNPHSTDYSRVSHNDTLHSIPTVRAIGMRCWRGATASLGVAAFYFECGQTTRITSKFATSTTYFDKTNEINLEIAARCPEQFS